ncbi:MAG: hypothetical protein IPM63_08825 [Acidobacteriota bacterium]|nr:MAG: hypothetical protein IPM63_08825 [Acidobacteriota bacterium]
MTTIYNLYSLGTTVLYGRGDLGRTEMFTESDLSISHRYKFGEDNKFTLEGFIDFRNIFDERNEIARQTTISGTNFTASILTAAGCATCATEADVFDTIFNGSGIQTFVENRINSLGVGSTGLRNDYNQPNSFQAGRDVRFGFRFFF